MHAFPCRAVLTWACCACAGCCCCASAGPGPWAASASPAAAAACAAAAAASGACEPRPVCSSVKQTDTVRHWQKWSAVQQFNWGYSSCTGCWSSWLLKCSPAPLEFTINSFGHLRRNPLAPSPVPIPTPAPAPVPY